MDRTDLQRLSKDELIKLVIQLQGPDPLGTMGKAISLRVWNLRAKACKVAKQIKTPRLSPSCGGLAPSAKRSV
jgi:hypothetical protein